MYLVCNAHCGAAWCCVVLRGVAWCCVVLRGVAWCCVVLRGVAWVVLCRCCVIMGIFFTYVECSYVVASS